MARSDDLSLCVRLRLKCDFVFRRNRRVHLNRRERRFSRLLAAEVCASAVVMLDTPCSKVVWRVLSTHPIHQFPLHLPSRASPCAITFQLDCTMGWWNHHQGTMVVIYWMYLLYWCRLSMYVVESLNVGISRQNDIVTKHVAVMQMVNHSSLYSVAVRATVRCDKVFCWYNVFKCFIKYQ